MKPLGSGVRSEGSRIVGVGRTVGAAARIEYVKVNLER
jgi:hypothetical protein